MRLRAQIGSETPLANSVVVSFKFRVNRPGGAPRRIVVMVVSIGPECVAFNYEQLIPRRLWRSTYAMLYVHLFAAIHCLKVAREYFSMERPTPDQGECHRVVIRTDSELMCLILTELLKYRAMDRLQLALGDHDQVRLYADERDVVVLWATLQHLIKDLRSRSMSMPFGHSTLFMMSGLTIAEGV